MWIVTPACNQGRFVARTVTSVRDQSYPNVEFLVMDGGATDDTVDVLRAFGDRGRWVSEPDRGQTHAINKGFATATGDIRGYLNSDDTLLPNAVETIVDHFLKQDDLDLIYGDADYIDEMDNVTGVYSTAEYSFERLMQDCCICQPAAFWRARIAEKVGAFDERLQFAMDFDYWLRIARQEASCAICRSSSRTRGCIPTRRRCSFAPTYTARYSISACATADT